MLTAARKVRPTTMFFHTGAQLMPAMEHIQSNPIAKVTFGSPWRASEMRGVDWGGQGALGTLQGVILGTLRGHPPWARSWGTRADALARQLGMAGGVKHARGEEMTARCQDRS